MKKFDIENINTKSYWDTHQTALDFGLRQQKYLDLAGKGYTILEIGCGLSPFLSEAKHNFSYAFGADFSRETLKQAKKLYPKVFYIELDASKLEDFDGHFDVVVAGEVIEHLENPDKFVKDLKRIGDKVIISTPQLEFEDKEHLWEFDEDYFISKGFKTEVVESERFKGRKYIFAIWEK